MNTGAISARYAKALFDVAKKHGTEDKVYEEMETIANSFWAVPELKKAMLNPLVKNEERKKLLLSAAGNDKTPVSDELSKFIDLVIEHKREAHFQTISLVYQDVYRKHKNIVIGKLTTAIEPESSLVEKMKQLVFQIAKLPADGKVEFETVVDPKIIGGFQLQVGSDLLDASVSSQLQEIRKTLLEKAATSSI